MQKILSLSCKILVDSDRLQFCLPEHCKTVNFCQKLQRYLFFCYIITNYKQKRSKSSSSVLKFPGSRPSNSTTFKSRHIEKNLQLFISRNSKVNCTEEKQKNLSINTSSMLKNRQNEVKRNIFCSTK